MDVGLALLSSLESCLLAQADGLNFYVLKAGAVLKTQKSMGGATMKNSRLVCSPLLCFKVGAACCSLSWKM